MARLKVFAARLGFFDTVIAAPSQKVALEAWGTKQNLFHDGTAQVSDDSSATAAALARPGVLLRRPVGSRASFEENPSPASRAAPTRRNAGKGAERTNRPPPDRDVLDKAEAALRRLDADYEPERRALAADAAALERRLAELDRDHRRAREKLSRALAAARRDYARAAGR